MAYNSLTVDPNLVARHRLDDNAPTKDVKAVVGSDGYVHANNWGSSNYFTNEIADVGPYGGALNLNGVSVAIGIPCSLSSAGGGVCFRMRLDSTPGSAVYAFSHRNGATNTRIYVAINANRTLTITYGNGGTATTTSALSVGQWYSIVITWSGSTCRLYIVGVLSATATGSYSGGWLGRYTLGAYSQASNETLLFADITVQDSMTFNRLLVVDDAAEFDGGPEPLNTVAPVLHDDGTVTSGTWDSQGNGTITRFTTLHLASDDSVVATSSATNPDFSSYVTPGLSYYVVERASNAGGYDAAEDTASAVIEIVGGGSDPDPITAGLTATLEGVTSVSAASLKAKAGITTTLEGVTALSAAVASIAAGASVLLDGVVSSSTAVSPIAAGTSIALEGVFASSSAASPITAGSTIQLEGVTASATASQSIVGNGSLSITLEGVAAISTAESLVSAGLSISLDGVTATASAVSPIVAGSTIQLDGVTATSTASQSIAGSGSVSIVLDGVTAQSAASSTIAAGMTVTLDGVASIAAASSLVAAGVTILLDGVTVYSAAGDDEQITGGVYAFQTIDGYFFIGA